MTPILRIAPFAGAAALLLGLIVVPLFLPLVPEPIAAPEPNSKTDAPTPSPVTSSDRDRWVEQALARPMFRADRKPEVAPDAMARAGAPLPRLTGITLSAAGNVAILQPEGGKAVTVAEGGVVAGWTVRSIAARRVTLAGADGERDLTLGPAAPRSHHRPS